jgi:hypothetical protein
LVILIYFLLHLQRVDVLHILLFGMLLFLLCLSIGILVSFLVILLHMFLAYSLLLQN